MVPWKLLQFAWQIHKEFKTCCHTNMCYEKLVSWNSLLWHSLAAKEELSFDGWFYYKITRPYDKWFSKVVCTKKSLQVSHPQKNSWHSGFKLITMYQPESNSVSITLLVWDCLWKTTRLVNILNKLEIPSFEKRGMQQLSSYMHRVKRYWPPITYVSCWHT